LGVVKKNKETAFKWSSKAADQGLAEAQYTLGICYDEGHGVAISKEMAYTYFQKAAANGSEKAKERLNNYHPRLFQAPNSSSSASPNINQQSMIDRPPTGF
jgi:TPR repeat protein